MNARHLPDQMARLPILPTPGLTAPRFARLRFMTADAGAAGTPGAPAGGDGEQGGQTPPATPAAPAEQPPAPKPGPPAAKHNEQQGFSREYVSELRSEAKSNREARQAAEQQLQTLQNERDQYQTELQTLRSEGALTTAITAANGNSVAALAIKGADVLKDVDLGNKEAVNAAVKTFIDEHPELQAAPTATRSGVPAGGGSGEQGQRPTSIREALERAQR